MGPTADGEEGEIAPTPRTSPSKLGHTLRYTHTRTPNHARTRLEAFGVQGQRVAQGVSCAPMRRSAAMIIDGPPAHREILLPPRRSVMVSRAVLAIAWPIQRKGDQAAPA